MGGDRAAERLDNVTVTAEPFPPMLNVGGLRRLTFRGFPKGRSPLACDVTKLWLVGCTVAGNGDVELQYRIADFGSNAT